MSALMEGENDTPKRPKLLKLNLRTPLEEIDGPNMPDKRDETGKTSKTVKAGKKKKADKNSRDDLDNTFDSVHPGSITGTGKSAVSTSQGSTTPTCVTAQKLTDDASREEAANQLLDMKAIVEFSIATLQNVLPKIDTFEAAYVRNRPHLS
jgi:aconitase A